MKKMKKRYKIPMIVLAIVLILAIAAYFAVSHYLNRIGREDPPVFSPEPTEELSEEERQAKEAIEPFMDDKLLNILLIGQDARPGQGRQRSDSMILCSVNPDTKRVSMISFMRDLYVDIPGAKSNRLNTAYVIGGFDLLKKTLLQNFGVTVDGCFEVNFDGFESVIDIAGGVDITLTSDEAWVVGGDAVEGDNHLNGEQALKYARIRKLDNDFKRTERQRNVLNALAENAKTKTLRELLSLANEMLPHVTTDMSNLQMMGMIISCYKMMNGADIQSYRIPGEGAFSFESIDGMSVLLPDLPKVREQLEEYLPL